MPKIGGAENAIKGVIPKFYMRPMLNEKKTRETGHAVYEDVEYIEVIILGSRSTRPNYKVTDKFRKKWPKHYEAFKKGTEYIDEGYRLSEWSLMTQAHVETLRGIGVHTMEQFSQIGDDQAKYLGLYQLKHEARKILASKDGKQEQIDDLKATNDILMKRLEALENKPKKKELTPEQKAKRAESLKKAREAKKKKLAEAAAAEE